MADWGFPGNVYIKGTRPHTDLRGFLPSSYVDGVTDVTAAVSSWVTAGAGGQLFAPAGNYIISGTTALSVADTTIYGAGRDATKFTVANGANVSAFTVSNGRITLRDFAIYGNKSNNTTGHSIDLTGAYDFTAHRLKIIQSAQDGLFSNNVSDLLNFWLTDVYISSTGRDSINLAHSAGIVAKGLILSTAARYNLHLLTSVENLFSTCVFDSSTNANIFLDNPCQKTTIAFSYIGGASGGGFVVSGDHLGHRVIGNYFNGNRGTVTTNREVYLEGANTQDILLQGNWFKETVGMASASAVWIADGPDYLIIKDNHLNRLNAPAINFVNRKANTIVKDNTGYITQNSGLTGAVATGTTVNHGLSVTPTQVILQAQDSTPTNVFPSALGATTFTVNFSGGGSHAFAWSAQ